ncbi:MAG: hypothetical protein IPP77_14420 [Bacteroidetes bacterium]|nr:hypothetical protein [Bacteroidota bacterium]
MEDQSTEEKLDIIKSKKGFAMLLGRLDSVSESGLKKVLTNMPAVLFLALLAILHIANNHMAENYVRSISRTEIEVKELRWQYMSTASDLMKKSKQSEVAKLVSVQGIKELRIPPYKIEVKKK